MARMGSDHGHDVGSWEHLANAPIRTLRAGLVTRLSSAAFVSGQLSYESGRPTRLGSETDASMVFDARFGSPRVWGGLGLDLVVKNVFDADVHVPVGWSYAQVALPQPGRKLRLALTWDH